MDVQSMIRERAFPYQDGGDNSQDATDALHADGDGVGSQELVGLTKAIKQLNARFSEEGSRA